MNRESENRVALGKGEYNGKDVSDQVIGRPPVGRHRERIEKERPVEQPFTLCFCRFR